MVIHIALIGYTKEPVLKGIQYYGKVSRLYLLHSPNQENFKFQEVAEDVKNRVSALGFIDVRLKKIDPFDMNSIVNAIIEIADREKGEPIYINITGGTNLMAGAATAASFIVGAKAYYVLDTRKPPEKKPSGDVIELPIPSIPFVKTMQTTQLTILRKIAELGGRVNNVHLREKLQMTPQKLSYHIRELERKGFVTTKRGWKFEAYKASKVDTRMLAIELTNAGRLVVSWIKGSRL
jgi:CRISPR locus-related DNA-binding protein